METLMIVIVLTFTPIQGTKNVEVRYEAKFGIKPNLESCQSVQRAFTEDRSKNVIVMCVESKEASKKKAGRQQET